MSEAPTPPQAAQSPVERLEATRARLRAALGARDGEAPRQRSGAAGPGGGRGSFIDATLRRLRRLWARHPLRPAARMLRQTAVPLMSQRLLPMARSHPLRMVGIAAGVGALLALLRPWRWVPRAAAGSLLISILLPRRLLWQELLASETFQRVLGSEWLSAWFAPADDRHDAPSAQAGARASDDSTTARASSPEGPGA